MGCKAILPWYVEQSSGLGNSYCFSSSRPIVSLLALQEGDSDAALAVLAAAGAVGGTDAAFYLHSTAGEGKRRLTARLAQQGGSQAPLQLQQVRACNTVYCQR